MPQTLKDLKDEADKRLKDGKVIDAIKVFRLVLEGAPLDFELRLDIGDVLAQLKAGDLAFAIYQAVAEHDAKSGSPLRAIAALKRAEAMGGDISAAAQLLADKYTVGSKVLGRGLRPAPADYSAQIRKGIDLDYEIDAHRLVVEIAQMAAYTGNIANYPAVVPPVPIFSSLERDGFLELLRRLELQRYNPGDAIIIQGETGHAVYFLARGEVSVIRIETGPDGADKMYRLARLGAGSLFGEMALVSADPRSASVVCDTPVDALKLTRENVDQLGGKIPQVAGAMARFTQERMITNLLATNPLFKMFGEDQGKKLLARFTGHEVPAGTVFLEQGSAGKGLYLLLQGRAEVLKWDHGEYVKVADLGPGDVAGEISLIYEEPVSATVRTTSKATLLFLARELFLPIIESEPELLAHFNRMAEQRLSDTEDKVAQKRDVHIDFDVDEEEQMEISDDELVFV